MCWICECLVVLLWGWFGGVSLRCSESRSGSLELCLRDGWRHAEQSTMSLEFHLE